MDHTVLPANNKHHACLTLNSVHAVNERRQNRQRHGPIGLRELNQLTASTENHQLSSSFPDPSTDSRWKEHCILYAGSPTPVGLPEGMGKKLTQEGQHPLTEQRAPPISGGTYKRRRILIDGYLESPFPTARLL